MFRTPSGGSVPLLIGTTYSRRRRISAFSKPSKALLRTLRRLEERGELPQVLLAERVELRHGRARIDTRRALQVPDLEVDPLVLRTLGGKVRRPELRPADTQIRVAVETTGLREQLRARDRGRVVREALLLRPRRHLAHELAAERLLRGRALVREHAHREDDEHGRDEGDRTPREPPLLPHVDER